MQLAMGRKINEAYYSRANLSLEDIYRTYEKTISAIDIKYSKEKNKSYGELFFACSMQDIREERMKLLSELEKEMSMASLACVEAYLRIDFRNRCELKKKDPLSKLYLEAYKPDKKPYSYSFNDLILQGWKDTYLQGKDRLVNQVNEFFVVYRHWLAHGRYWKLGQPESKFDYYSVYCVLKEFIHTIELDLMEVRPEDVLFKSKEHSEI